MILLRLIPLIALMGASFALPGTAAACGVETDCPVGERYYRIRLPEGYDAAAKTGAILYSHGYRGSAAGAMRNKALGAVADRLGVALIAVKSAGDDWALPYAPGLGPIDVAGELAYFDAVRADVVAQFGIDPDRIMATGFSAGGMMTWTLACHRSADFAGFAPIAGTFWAPIPETCAAPVASIIHIHGDADRIVPLGGRRIGDTFQGDVAGAIEMYAQMAGMGAPQPRPEDGLDCADRTNAESDLLRFCIFSGGHSFRAPFVEMAWRMFEERGRL